MKQDSYNYNIMLIQYNIFLNEIECPVLISEFYYKYLYQLKAHLTFKPVISFLHKSLVLLIEICARQAYASYIMKTYLNFPLYLSYAKQTPEKYIRTHKENVL